MTMSQQDWSRVERLTPKPGQETEQDHKAMVPVPPQADVPMITPPTLQGSIDVPLQQPLDFIGKLKANAKNRKAVMAALDAHYASQLDGLQAQLAAGLRVHKTKVDLQAEEYLKTLDARHLEVLGQLGVRNAATRWQAIMELNDLAVAKIKEVQDKQWPDSLIDDTITQILSLRKRVAAEVMRELGAENPESEKTPAL
jgi:hypothetical protein